MNKSEMKNLMKAPFSEIIKAIKDKDVGKELKDLDNLQSVCKDLSSLVDIRKLLLKIKENAKNAVTTSNLILKNNIQPNV